MCIWQCFSEFSWFFDAVHGNCYVFNADWEGKWPDTRIAGQTGSRHGMYNTIMFFSLFIKLKLLNSLTLKLFKAKTVLRILSRQESCLRHECIVKVGFFSTLNEMLWQGSSSAQNCTCWRWAPLLAPYNYFFFHKFCFNLQKNPVSHYYEFFLKNMCLF